MDTSSTLCPAAPQVQKNLRPIQGEDSVRAAEVRASKPWERWLARQLFASLGSPDARLELWDGFHVSSSTSHGTVRLLQPEALRKIALQSSVGFGEAYAQGTLEIEGDFVGVLVAINRALSKTSPNWFSRLCDRWQRTRHRHSLDESRSTVFHHYDIGNEFYQLWLDQQLVYTCAYYARPGLTLEEAQVAKFDHVCRKLRLKPGERVVEAGCGWGALALHMARNYGVQVKAFNLSREQVAFARDRAKAEGLADRVEFVQDDYRQIQGQFEAFVSVGMLEHVGVDHYGGLGRLIHRSLQPNGRGLIHTIGRNTPAPVDAWTDKYIFPGAEPPSLGQMMTIFESGGLSVLDVENLRLHYAKTLEEWYQRFEINAEKIEQNFDSRFVRMWRLYLCGSIAAFLSGDLQLFQVHFSRAGSNEVPWTRADLYCS